MATAPTSPVAPSPTPETAPLSQGARIINTFIAPSKTFTDLRRSAAWWAPFLLMTVVSVIFVYTAGQKIGFRKIMENQMQTQPKAQARLEALPADQREKQMEGGAKFTAIFSYCFPILTLIIWLIIATALFATFKVAAGADVSFGVSFAIVIYAALPLMLKTILATISVLAGLNPDSFSFQNPAATNPGYFMPTDHPSALKRNRPIAERSSFGTARDNADMKHRVSVESLLATTLEPRRGCRSRQQT